MPTVLSNAEHVSDIHPQPQHRVATEAPRAYGHAENGLILAMPELESKSPGVQTCCL